MQGPAQSQPVPTAIPSRPGPPLPAGRRWAAWPCAALLLTLGCLQAAAAAPSTTPDDAAIDSWRRRFEATVDRRLQVPADEQRLYEGLLQAALAGHGIDVQAPQALLLVDRSTQVQAAFVLVKRSDAGWSWLGASPVSTGRVGRFDHFRTPLGVFPHGPSQPDFRAEGTFNENHIRGYGRRGLRVFDFGWVQAERGWGTGGLSPMRLQVHATDPTVLEPRLGQADSKGCIRIAATLNHFIDQHGLLDIDYEAAAALGKAHWVLKPDREPVPWPGRYLVVVDSGRAKRPAWAPPPGAARSGP